MAEPTLGRTGGTWSTVALLLSIAAFTGSFSHLVHQYVRLTDAYMQIFVR
jgi:hypothetical protein